MRNKLFAIMLLSIIIGGCKPAYDWQTALFDLYLEELGDTLRYEMIKCDESTFPEVEKHVYQDYELIYALDYDNVEFIEDNRSLASIVKYMMNKYKCSISNTHYYDTDTSYLVINYRVWRKGRYIFNTKLIPIVWKEG